MKKPTYQEMDALLDEYINLNTEQKRDVFPYLFGSMRSDMTEKMFDIIQYAIRRTKEVPKSTRTIDQLIRLFTMDGKPYSLRYNKLGRARKSWLADKVLLDQLIKERLVNIVAKDRSTITYNYTPKEATV